MLEKNVEKIGKIQKKPEKTELKNNQQFLYL